MSIISQSSQSAVEVLIMNETQSENFGSIRIKPRMYVRYEEAAFC